MANAVELAVTIVTKYSDAGMGQAESKFGKFQSGVSKAAKVSAVALGLLGAAAISSAKAAAEDEQSQALLAQTLSNVGATKSQIAATEDFIASMSKATGVADDEMRPALGTLARATGDVEESQKALRIALDVAAATGKPLASVSAAMAKGYAGQTTALGRLVPGMDKAVLASGDMNKVMKELARTTGGSAAAAAETSAGKWRKFQTQMGEAQESIGAALLPLMAKLADALESVATWAQENATTFQIVATVVAVVAASIIALNIALKAMAVIQGVTAAVALFGTTTAGTAIGVWALTAAEYAMAVATAILASPILIVVAVLALLAAAVVLAWKNSETFRDVTKAVWAAIVSAAQSAWNLIKRVWDNILDAGKTAFNWIKNNWAYLLAGLLLGPFGIAVVAIVKNWDAIKAAAVAVFNWLRDEFGKIWNMVKTAASGPLNAVQANINDVRAAADAVVKFVSGAFSTVWNGAKNAATSALSPIVAAINAIKSAIDWLIGAIGNLISALSRIKVPHIDLPGPLGGLLSAPVPSDVAPMSAARSAYAPRVPGRTSLRATSGGSVVNVTVTGAVDPEATARQIKRILDGHNRRVGLAT